MKKITLLFFVLCLGVSSCADKKTDKDNPEDAIDANDIETTTDDLKETPLKQQAASEAYFKANGTEPFWSLTISDNMIKLKTISDSIMTPHTTPNRAQDANVKLYKLHTELAKMNIQISHSECVNAMSGLSSPYSVTVEYLRGRDTESTKLEGCGTYQTDYRLHDIWVLEVLNGNEVTQEDFGNKLPSMEINTTSNSFTGNAGCNNMNGRLFFEYGLLRFVDILTTKKMCPNNQETEFLNALKASTNYKIEHNRLWLLNQSKQLLVFKKVD